LVALIFHIRCQARNILDTPSHNLGFFLFSRDRLGLPTSIRDVKSKRSHLLMYPDSILGFVLALLRAHNQVSELIQGGPALLLLERVEGNIGDVVGHL